MHDHGAARQAAVAFVGAVSVGEAPLRGTKYGLVPDGDGWFVVNARETRWREWGRLGVYCDFEGKRRFPQLGINLSVLEPGQSLGRYHRENAQEDFLVLAGECVLLVNEEERPLGTWDFFHCPAGTEHVLVGAGEGLSVVLAVGTRPAEEWLRYPRSEVAERFDASAERDTNDPREAYSRFERPRHERPDYWDELPWA